MPPVFPNQCGERLRRLSRKHRIAAFLTDSGPRSATGPPRRRVIREVVEATLAHKVRNPVETAYARSDLLERRRWLMDDWVVYLAHGASLDGARSRRS